MNISVEIKNGILDSVANGITLVNSNVPTSLKLKIDSEFITLIIKFENYEKDKEIKKEAKVVDSTTLEIVFTNYNHALGNYTKEFWRIGQMKNRYLYWGYSIHGLEDADIKKIDYSFYLGEEVVNG